MKRFRLRGEAAPWRDIENEIVAVDLANSTYLSANESGGVLWRRLADGATREGLTQELADRFGIDDERAGADVDSFLRELEGRNLLES